MQQLISESSGCATLLFKATVSRLTKQILYKEAKNLDEISEFLS